MPSPHELVLQSPHQTLCGALGSSSMPGPNVGSLLMGMRHCLCQSKGPGCPSRCYYHQSDSLNPIMPYHAPQPSPSQEPGRGKASL